MLFQYLPILVFILLGLIMGLVLLGAGALFGAHKPDSEKNAPYECGFAPFESSHIFYYIRFRNCFFLSLGPGIA